MSSSPIGGVSILPLRRLFGDIDDVAFANHKLDVVVRLVIDDPLRLLVENLRIGLRIVLRVRQDNDGEIRRRYLCQCRKTEGEKNCKEKKLRDPTIHELSPRELHAAGDGRHHSSAFMTEM